MTEQTEKKTLLDRDMPAGMGKVLGRIGPKTWLDFMVMCAGIVSVLIIIIQWATMVPAPNGWKMVFFILAIWVYVDLALFTKLGPFFASKFKRISGAFTFLRDENDAKNFVVIIGAWTAALDTLMSAITSGGSFWVILAYLGPLVVFGLFLLKGPLDRLVTRLKGGRTAKAEKKPEEKVVKAEPKAAPKPEPKPEPEPEPKPEPKPAPVAEEEAPAPAPKPAAKPAKKSTKKAAKKPAV